MDLAVDAALTLVQISSLGGGAVDAVGVHGRNLRLHLQRSAEAEGSQIDVLSLGHLLDVLAHRCGHLSWQVLKDVSEVGL